MKRHHEVMRVMRTKIVDPRELSQCEESIFYVEEAIRYRVKSLTSMSAMLFLEGDALTWSSHADNFSQHKLDIRKQFENFALGIVIIFFLILTNWHTDLLGL
jgi:hypothetical protein